MISLGNFKDFSFAKKNTNLFNDILNSVQGNIVEYGIKANFEINDNGEEYCLALSKRLNLINSDINIKKSDKFYSIEFSKNGEKGYIEYSSYDNHNVVTINMIKTDNMNRIEEYKTTIKKAISKNEQEVKYFEFIKAKVQESDNLKLNNEIINVLKIKGAENIYSVELENGISTVAYTKQFTAMKNNGKKMDLNFAVCSYSSGNYLIIGTPIIIEAY
jgi:hypothetical protein